jgi:hypothetical protein
MAHVYEATDVRHRRKVAIKVLRPELAIPLGTERFLREIETSAGLRHPHILPIFDSGDVDGSTFFVMPFVVGESLRTRLDRDGQLPMEDAIRMEHAVELAPDNNLWLAQLGQAYGLSGMRERAEAILAALLERSRSAFVSPYHLAYIYTGLGRHDEAMDCLERAAEQRSGSTYGIKGSFLFAPLRTHPRFVALLERMRLA